MGELQQAASARISEQLAELRHAHEQQAAHHAAEILTLKSQAATATARGDELTKRHMELVRNWDALDGQLEQTRREVEEKQAVLSRVETALSELRRSTRRRPSGTLTKSPRPSPRPQRRQRFIAASSPGHGCASAAE